jgi:OPA family sugar phosphate sensor protein UhpC-like MFS transporter
MATPLTREHRSWRSKVFVATWLSYVGFYFCRKPFSVAKATLETQVGWDKTTLANIYAAYLIAYAIGQLLASRMGPRLGPRVNVLLGMGLSCLVTVGMGIASDPFVMAGLFAVNGLAQATGWSGNVGTMAGWFHKHERGRVMGIWSTNFTVGALSSAWVLGWVLSMHEKGAPSPWRWAFFVGSIVLGIVWVQFYFLQRNRPEDVGLPPIDDPVTPVDESKEPEPPPTGFMGLSRDAWTNLLLVGAFYFFAKLIRYAVWSWSQYFLEVHYKMPTAESAVYATAFDLLGLPGVFFTGWLSDKYFQSRRAGVATIMMLGMMVSTALLIAFGSTNVTAFIVLLGAVGFTLYGPDALLSGAGAIDVGGRHRATFVTGVIATMGALGPVLQEVVIARIYNPKTGGLAPVFTMLFASAALGTLFCFLLVLRNRKGGKGI